MAGGAGGRARGPSSSRPSDGDGIANSQAHPLPTYTDRRRGHDVVSARCEEIEEDISRVAAAGRQHGNGVRVTHYLCSACPNATSQSCLCISLLRSVRFQLVLGRSALRPDTPDPPRFRAWSRQQQRPWRLSTLRHSRSNSSRQQWRLSTRWRRPCRRCTTDSVPRPLHARAAPAPRHDGSSAPRPSRAFTTSAPPPPDPNAHRNEWRGGRADPERTPGRLQDGEPPPRAL